MPASVDFDSRIEVGDGSRHGNQDAAIRLTAFQHVRRQDSTRRRANFSEEEPLDSTLLVTALS
jgi:hypothetical protein